MHKYTGRLKSEHVTMMLQWDAEHYARLLETVQDFLNKLGIKPHKLYFLLYYLHGYSKIWNIGKSNKSELWNHLSYIGLLYIFGGEETNFKEQLQKFEVAAVKFNNNRHLTSTTTKGLNENLKKKCHWIFLFFP